jgi:UDP-N-acetylmuramoyl-tripeptide--D-alanyl-D-alanine ligase
MAVISLQQAAQWCGGRIDPKYKDVCFEGANIDSRKVQKGELFVALKAARDGHDFIPAALEKGAAAVLCSRVEGDFPAIVVEDTRIALGLLAKNMLCQMDTHVVAVTGSVGKSTTKEMIAAVLSQKVKTAKTPANHNNDLGLPAAVLAMDEHSGAVVLEMGMSHFGEIEYLSHIGQPEKAVIINVGTMHIENLGSREGILQAKLEITKGMSPDSTLYILGDEPLLWNARASLNVKVHTFGEKNTQCDTVAKDVQEGADGIRFTVCRKDLCFPVHLNLEGRHYVSDALAAVCVGLDAGLTVEQIQKGLEGFQNMEGRQEIFVAKDCTVIKDCYNAGPESMAAALEVLGKRPGRKIAVLGDMLELGDHSKPEHEKIGRLVSQKADILLCYGPESAYICAGAVESGMKKENALHFLDRESLAQQLKKMAQKGDVMLFKGSRGMKMELALELFLQ